MISREVCRYILMSSTLKRLEWTRQYVCLVLWTGQKRKSAVFLSGDSFRKQNKKQQIQHKHLFFHIYIYVYDVLAANLRGFGNAQLGADSSLKLY